MGAHVFGLVVLLAAACHATSMHSAIEKDMIFPPSGVVVIGEEGTYSLIETGDVLQQMPALPSMSTQCYCLLSSAGIGTSQPSLTVMASCATDPAATSKTQTVCNCLNRVFVQCPDPGQPAISQTVFFQQTSFTGCASLQTIAQATAVCQGDPCANKGRKVWSTKSYSTTPDESDPSTPIQLCTYTTVKQQCTTSDPCSCVMSPWVVAQPCTKTCGTDTQTSTRTVVQEPSNGGEACGATVSVDACALPPCPVDCLVSEWSAYGACSNSCGIGAQTRTRTIEEFPSNGGKACPSDDQLTDSVQCVGTLCPTNCVVTEWGPFSECSASCGAGQATRTRVVTIAATNGGSCVPLEESAPCTGVKCPVDCQPADSWSDWSPCSASCGQGQQTRSRAVKIAASNGGKECAADALLQSQLCTGTTCPTSCATGPWSEWSACSASCGPGTQSRSRTITQATNGGLACPAALAAAESQSCTTVNCPIDCQPGEWTPWLPCSNPSGVGTTSRTRPKLVLAQFSGVDCPDDSLIEKAECTGDRLPVDCVMSEWSAWGTCSVSCGTGTQERTRVVTLQEQFGGKCADGALVDSQPCTMSPCAVDCQVSEWTLFSACSSSCGQGTYTRTRTVVVQPVATGSACPVLEDTQTCTGMQCPNDCVLSEWTEWGRCSSACGEGARTRTRTVTQQAVNGGNCAPTTESFPCQGTTCPVDCVVTDWSDWSACSNTCGPGVSTRTKMILTESINGGTPCPESSSLNETVTCQSSLGCPSNCEWTEWTEWTPCSASCGPGTQSRQRQQLAPATNGGSCDESSSFDQRACAGDACPRACLVTEWSAFTSCSASCGGGQQHRTRVVSQLQQNGGTCTDPLDQVELCNTQPCPVDCSFTEWSVWSLCTSPCDGGTTQRTRSVLAAQNGGKACDPSQSITDIAFCNTQQCPCFVSEWSVYGDCSTSCGEGVQTRNRQVTLYEGKLNISYAIMTAVCPALTESLQCNVDNPCPQDCIVSEWGPWGTCSASCGGGIAARERNITQPAVGRGSCLTLTETAQCNTQVCNANCELDQWSEWSVCSSECGGGSSIRTRAIVSPAQGSGTCEGTLETLPCNTDPCSVNCQVGEWSAYGPCTAACGGGTMTKTRNITAPAAGNGTCPALSESEPCNTAPCNRDCMFGMWSSFSPCTVSCGGGTRSRSRNITTPAVGNGKCPVTEDIEACNTQECDINCQVSDWGVWSACSVPCGGGERVRQRSVTLPKRGNGAACPALSETNICNTATCSNPVDCVVGPWSPCSACSASCGGGQCTRTRPVVTPASNRGAACPPTSEQLPCNSQSCPSQCEPNACGTVVKALMKCEYSVRYEAWLPCSIDCRVLKHHKGGFISGTTERVRRSLSGGNCAPIYQQSDCKVFITRKDVKRILSRDQSRDFLSYVMAPTLPMTPVYSCSN